MFEDVTRDIQGRVAPFVGAIVSDLSTLMRQEVALAKEELKEEIAATKIGLVSVLLGALLLQITCMLLALGFVYFVSWLLPTIHIALCFVIVAAVMGVISIALISCGQASMFRVPVFPFKVMKSFKEVCYGFRRTFSQRQFPSVRSEDPANSSLS